MVNQLTSFMVYHIAIFLYSLRYMKILTITGYKGGVGKSTTAIHLAAFLHTHAPTVLIDGDPNRTALNWAKRGAFPFETVDQRQAMKVASQKGLAYMIIDTPARPDSDDMKVLTDGCDLLILPTKPDVISLKPMLQTITDLGTAKFRVLLTIVPPYPSKEGETMQKDLIANDMPVFKSMVRRTNGFEKAALAGQTIKDLNDPRLKSAWSDYVSVGKEVLEALQ